MNKVVIMGRMANDPELRQTTSGIAVTSFTVAVDRQQYKDKEKETDWIDVVAWRGTAEFICKYFGKGSPIILEGALQSRNWEDKNGNKRKSIEVQADTVEFVLRSKQDDGTTRTTVQEAKNEEEFADVTEDVGEDLPF